MSIIFILTLWETQFLQNTEAWFDIYELHKQMAFCLSQCWALFPQNILTEKWQYCSMVSYAMLIPVISGNWGYISNQSFPYKYGSLTYYSNTMGNNIQ